MNLVHIHITHIIPLFLFFNAGSLSQRRIAVYEAQRIGSVVAASIQFNISHSILSRWVTASRKAEKKALFPPPPPHHTTPTDSDPPRPLNQLVPLDPWDRTEAENVRVFDFLGKKDIDELVEEEEFQVENEGDEKDDGNSDDEEGLDPPDAEFDFDQELPDIESFDLVSQRRNETLLVWL